MAKGTNADGEESGYTYNGLGKLVSNDWAIQDNNYGYNGTAVHKDYVLDYV